MNILSVMTISQHIKAMYEYEKNFEFASEIGDDTLDVIVGYYCQDRNKSITDYYHFSAADIEDIDDDWLFGNLCNYLIK
jgi:hypothetical protein